MSEGPKDPAPPPSGQFSPADRGFFAQGEAFEAGKPNPFGDLRRTGFTYVSPAKGAPRLKLAVVACGLALLLVAVVAAAIAR